MFYCYKYVDSFNGDSVYEFRKVVIDRKIAIASHIA